MVVMVVMVGDIAWCLLDTLGLSHIAWFGIGWMGIYNWHVYW
jgi:hypothetical protein